MKQRARSYRRNNREAIARRPPRRRLLSVLVAQALSMPLAAQAASVQVTSPADDDGAGCTLREAIQSVNANSASGGCTKSGAGGLDEVRFGPSVSGDTISLTKGQLTLIRSVAVNPGGSQTTIDANGGSRIFYSDTPGIEIDLERLVLTGGNALEGGGAIKVAADLTLNLTGSTVSGNTADAVGGIFAAFSTMTLTNSTVSGNSAETDFGGIAASDGSSLTLTNSTVSGNTADEGGGIITTSSTVTLINSTVSGNSAGYGGIYARGSAVTLTNSIVANSRGAGQDCEQDGTSTVTADGDSIIETDACGTDATEVDPGLLPLADNGGPTETHALVPGSPAIDAGDQTACVNEGITVDQRGVDRDDGMCDIGAFEFAETVLPIAFQDRLIGGVLDGADQWYRFDSMTRQRVSIQTNGFEGDTRIELYDAANPSQVMDSLANDDDSGPEQFSNIRMNVDKGNHLIKVIGNPDANPYFLRLMSAEDILTFADAQGHFAETAIGVMSAAGITGGCGSGMYCPDDPVTRAQMALFMLRAIQGGNQRSPAATGNVFGDVGPNSFAANAIEEFSTLGITAGCGGGNYCPDDPVTREQMAIFLLRALFGAAHTPPQATQAEINQFNDISDSFARDWIVQLVDEGITAGCGGNRFCPTDPVTRGQMAAFIQRTFDLDTDLQM